MDKPRIMMLKATEKHEMPRTLFIHKEPMVASTGTRPRNTVHMPGTLAGAGVPAKPTGRPSKDELRKQKIAAASANIAALVSMEPKKKDIAAFMRARIAELSAEKR